MLELPWLPIASADIDEKINAFDVSSQEAASELRHIVCTALNTRQTQFLYNKVKDLKDKDIAKLKLAKLKLCIVGNATFEHLISPLKIAGLRHNVYFEILTTDFGQAAQIAFNPPQDVLEFNPDMVFLFDVDHQFSQTVDEKLAQTLSYTEKYTENFGATTIVSTIVPPVHTHLTDTDLSASNLWRRKVADYNIKLADEVPGTPNILFDADALASNVGKAIWCNPTYYYMAKMPFDPSCANVFSDRFASLMAANCGKSRRALILDCDNTLWGGVIGDDGINGIKIGPGSGQGEAYIAIQRMALDLRSRGVVLAVSSKNTESVALEVFQKHPEMLIKEKDVSVFQVNWTDKAANIKKISEILNLGLQSFVFLDDNPAERERVRSALPEVAVPEVGADPTQYPALVAFAGYFNSTAFSSEDAKRADMYTANAQRAAALDTMGDFDDYLKSLEMKIQLLPFDDVGRARITQLINKSNQFNLTTRRYSTAEVKKIQENPDELHLQIRLVDRFGDNGMISVVTLKKAPQIWKFDLWLMSCRVLGRRVEEYVLDYIVGQAISENVKTLKGVFIPTDRNAIVAEHYKKLGFTLEDKKGEIEYWVLDVETHNFKFDLPFKTVKA